MVIALPESVATPSKAMFGTVSIVTVPAPVPRVAVPPTRSVLPASPVTVRVVPVVCARSPICTWVNSAPLRLIAELAVTLTLFPITTALLAAATVFDSAW